MNDQDKSARQKYLEHVRDASHQASQDFDGLVAKLGTAGITVTTAVAGLTDAPAWGFLIASGIAFALALASSLLSIRLSADGLRVLGTGKKAYAEIRQFGWVRWLNWLSLVAISTAFMLLALHLLDATIRSETR